MDTDLKFCCDDFQSAYKATFVNPIDGPTGWLLYGTDYDSVSVGQPKLRYWPIKYCPFCGTRLALPTRWLLRRTRKFGWESSDFSDPASGKHGAW